MATDSRLGGPINGEGNTGATVGEANAVSPEQGSSKLSSWRKMLGIARAPPHDGASLESSEDGDEILKGRPEKWSLGILNDRITDEVPGKSHIRHGFLSKHSQVLLLWPRCFDRVLRPCRLDSFDVPYDAQRTPWSAQCPSNDVGLLPAFTLSSRLATSESKAPELGTTFGPELGRQEDDQEWQDNSGATTRRFP